MKSGRDREVPGFWNSIEITHKSPNAAATSLLLDGLLILIGKIFLFKQDYPNIETVFGLQALQWSAALLFDSTESYTTCIKAIFLTVSMGEKFHVPFHLRIPHTEPA